jgi:hypothetical protein
MQKQAATKIPSSEVESQTILPAYNSWPELLRRNLANRDTLFHSLGEKRVEIIREQLIMSARIYSDNLLKLTKVSSLSGELTGLSPASINYTPKCVIVMTGHQPVIYHSGISFKVELLSKFSSASQALAVNITIDSDIGSDGGDLRWLAPNKVTGDPLIKSRSVVQSSSALYADQVIGEPAYVADVFLEAVSDLRACGLLKEAERVKAVGEIYTRLAGINLAAAHAVVRWIADPELRVLELPISKLFRGDNECSELSSLVSELAYDYLRLVNIYNQTLDSYRTEHRIENLANPFPNMRHGVGDDKSLGVELPLWRIRDPSRGVEREAIFSAAFDRGEIKSMPPGEYIATRGSITTLLLRGFCSDLFVHGLGGAKYDKFVDRFAEAYLGVKLPAYVVASRTGVINVEKLRELKVVLELASQIKEVVSRCEGYIGLGVFSQEEERELAPLLARRVDLRAELSGARIDTERRAVARELNGLNSAVRAVVEGALRRSLEQLGISTARGMGAALEVLNERIKVWGCRELGFFYGPRLRYFGS